LQHQQVIPLPTALKFQATTPARVGSVLVDFDFPPAKIAHTTLM
jgi:hypothetical protein